MAQSRVQELLTRLRPMVRQPGIDEMCQLLNAYVDEWKEELVEAKGEDVPKLQGAIKRVRQTLLELTRKNHSKPFKDGAYTGEAT